MRYVSWIILLILVSSRSFAAEYKVDYAKSRLEFSGKYIEDSFNGVFKVWSADIDFYPEDVTKTKVKATIDLSSAVTGNAMYDGTLLTADWLDSKKEKEAYFESTSVHPSEADQLILDGNLTLRGKTHPVSITFMLEPSEHKPEEVLVRGGATINRMDYDIGAESDPKGEWVGKDIYLKMSLVTEVSH